MGVVSDRLVALFGQFFFLVELGMFLVVGRLVGFVGLLAFVIVGLTVLILGGLRRSVLPIGFIGCPALRRCGVYPLPRPERTSGPALSRQLLVHLTHDELALVCRQRGTTKEEPPADWAGKLHVVSFRLPRCFSVFGAVLDEDLAAGRLTP